MTEQTVRGMLSLDELQQKIENGEIETVVTAFPDAYGRLMGKRITGEFFLESAAEHGMHACDYLYTVDMEMEPIPGYKYASWELGYGDFHAVPDLATLRQATWLDKSALVLCDSFDEKTGNLVDVAPRSVLKRQVGVAAEMGYAAVGASELEYYIFEDNYRSSHEKNYTNLRRFGHYIEDYHILQGTREEPLNAAARKHLSASGVPVEFSKGEWGPGQHELNIRYAPVLEMADRHTIYKQCMKDLADQLDLSVTFMAKVDEQLAGSSCHIHISLWDEAQERNIFDGDMPLAEDAHLPTVSQEFLWFLGGWLRYVPELMPFFAPTVNSYKRYQPGTFAPTGIAWSYDNRTAGFRVVGHGKSLRIETRIPGADVNPYLAYAALLAAGLAGIREQIEPSPIFKGDVYAAEGLPQIPVTLPQSIAALVSSSIAVDAFGQDVVAHYLHFFNTEQALYNRAVTDWERRRYFEQI
ncbi:MAG: glutamine synthetase [Chloroflexi bacterium]|nr:MAG: glutamine synthetase [Phototrophicales bacterium]RMF79674.1 MAG: glutamine synthetase [Chloroflexota bacterium]